MLVKRQSHRNYYAVFRDGYKHKWISLGTDDEKTALALHESIKSRYNANRLKGRIARLLGEPETKPKPLMIRDVEARYTKLNPSYSPSGLRIWRNFRTWLNRDYEDISSITTMDALAFLDSLEGSGKWFNNCKMALSKIWHTLKPFSMIPGNIWQDIPAKPRSSINFRPFSTAEIKALLVALDEPDTKDGVLIALHTGLRRKDIYTLRKDAIRNDAIELIPAKTIKHHKAVYIPIHPAIQTIIRARLDGDPSSPYLFPVRALHYNSGAFARHFHAAIQTAGIKDTAQGRVSFHSLRTTFITRAEEAGISRQVVQGIVGHGSPAMTAHYSHDKESAKALRKLRIV
jgi:integrase